MSETTGQVQEEDQVDEREAEAAFAAGFDSKAKAEGTDSATAVKETAAVKEEETKAQKEAEESKRAEAAKKEAEQKAAQEHAANERKFMEGLPGRIRNLEGHIGGLNSKLDTVVATAKAAAKESGADAPTAKQIEAAISSPEAWKKLEEDFPDWAAPVKAEFAAVRKEIAEARAAAGGGAANLQEIRQTIAQEGEAAEERAYLRMKHPEWKQTVNTPDFLAWTLEGGPSREQFAEMKSLEKSDPAKAGEMVVQFSRQFPKWWGDRGAAIFDPSANAAIALLDNFSKHKTQAASAADTRLRQQKRLAGAVVPKGSSAPPSPGIDDEAAFNAGFQRVAGKK